ncbi:hypothetical protein B7R87_26635 [Streptomyces tsukubensis]|nr:hypothetical protein [Streptomyces sp. SID5473]AZK98665.1 hypothetical protein B7R87_26635 [Streptomyces tsukubensis]
MTTRSFIARPTPDGYTGIYVHLDGTPASKLPLLLTAFQYRFGRNLTVMTRHLVDDVAVGWDELGSDLLHGAPVQTVTLLTGGELWPSRTLDHLITPDGSPPVRMTVTETTAADMDLQWGYILHPYGLEVVAVTEYERGPLVRWDTDPLSTISDDPAHWAPGLPAPVADRRPTPAPTAPPPTADGAPQRTARR